MRRRSIVLAVLVAIVLLATACSESDEVALTESDAGRTVTISTGNELTVQLPSNVTTGFRWVVADVGPLEQRGESTYDAPQEAEVVGGGGTETFRFEATTPGSGELTLEYRRPWESDVAAEKTWSVTVSVR